MKFSLLSRWMVAAVPLWFLANRAPGAEESLVTAVYSKAWNGYERTLNADGSIKRETYVVANRGYEPGLVRDPSIDSVKFAGIARALAPYLAQKDYYPAPGKETADLMLVLSWGTTKPFYHPGYQTFVDGVATSMKDLHSVSGLNGGLLGSAIAKDLSMSAEVAAVQTAAQQDLVGTLMTLSMAETMRDQTNEHNAKLLGYIDEINRRRNISRHAGAGTAYDELIEDIEAERYYVVISAYDFQALLKQKQRRLLWSTRVSIRAQGNRFDTWLPAMLDNASAYFGQSSKRLVRQFQRRANVELGELKALGIADDATVQPATR